MIDHHDATAPAEPAESAEPRAAETEVRRGRSRAELERRAASERALREITGALVAIRDPARLLQLVVDAASRLVGADGTILGLLDPDRRFLTWSYDDGLRARFDPDYVANLTLDVGVGVTGRAIVDGRPIVVRRDLVEEFPKTPESLHFFEVSGFKSMVAVPIVADEGPLGALEVYAAREDAFDDADASILQTLASQAAIALTNARLIEELAHSRAEVERRAEAERALREIGARLTAIRDPRAVLQHAVDAAVRLLRADGALLDLIDPATGLIRWAYDSGIADEVALDILRRLELPVGVGMFGRAVAERRVLATPDYMADDRFSHAAGADEFARRVGYHSFVAAPLIAESGVLGVLGVYAAGVDAFDTADIALLGAFADQATVAIVNSRLIDELARSREEIERRAEAERTLREITARITALRDPGEVLQQVVDESKRLLGSDGAHLTLMADDRTVLHPVVVAGGADADAEAWLKTQEFPVGGGMNGLAAATNRPAWTFDYLEDPRIPHEPDDQEVARRLGLRGMAVAPLRAAEGETIGTLAVSTLAPRDFGDDEIGLLQGLADQAAIAVTNLRLYERLAASESRYRFLVQNAPDVVWSLDANGAWTFVSPAIERFGWRYEDLVGRPFWEIVRPERRDELMARWSEALASATGEIARFRSELVTPEGEPIAVEIIANPMIEEGRFLGGYGVTRDVRESDRLERELRASEERYRLLVQSSPDLIWAADLEGRFTFLSDRSPDFFGLPAADLIAEHWSKVVHPESLPEANDRWASLLADPTRPQTLRLTLLGSEGRPLAAELSTIASTDDDGHVTGALGSVRDVTSQARLERELRESEARFRFLVDYSPDLVYEIAADGTFRYVSDTSERLLGTPPHEFIGRHFSEVVAPGSLPEAAARWAAIIADPTVVQTFELGLLHADGRALPFEVSAIGRTLDGAFAGIHGSSRDIGERLALQRELRESEARFRYLVETSPDVIWQVDADGMFTYLSDTARTAFGWVPEDLVGRHFRAVVAPNAREEAAAAWARIVTNDHSVEHARVHLRRGDGSDVATEVYSISTFEGGRFAGAHGSLRDITERDRLERDLREQASELAASDERAHLARELHDSVTQGLFSMTLLTRSIELLLQKDPAAAAEKLADLRELQRDALAETRALIFELRPSSLDEDGLVKALRTHAAAVQGRIGLPVVIEADEIGRLPHAAEDALYRIGQEALHNVVKHANARQVRISVEAAPPRVRLVVEDDGTGFDPETVPSGHMGLAGMRARAEKVGGTLAVASRPGGGTRIEVSVPADASAE